MAAGKNHDGKVGAGFAWVDVTDKPGNAEDVPIEASGGDLTDCGGAGFDRRAMSQDLDFRESCTRRVSGCYAQDMSCDADFIAQLYRFLALDAIAGDPGMAGFVLNGEDDGVRGIVQNIADFCL